MQVKYAHTHVKLFDYTIAIVTSLPANTNSNGYCVPKKRFKYQRFRFGLNKTLI